MSRNRHGVGKLEPVNQSVRSPQGNRAPCISLVATYLSGQQQGMFDHRVLRLHRVVSMVAAILIAVLVCRDNSYLKSVAWLE